MKSSLKGAPLALLALLVCLQPAPAQQKGANLSERSYAQARRVLDAGIEALGGLDALRASQEVTLKVTGTSRARNQSVDITTAYDRTPLQEWLYVDLANRRYIFEQRTEAPGGFVFGGRNVIEGNQGFFVNSRDKTFAPINMANFNNIGLIRRLPHLMLLALRDNGPATLRSLGEDTFDGRKHNVITAASTNGNQWTLYFDAATNLLSKYELVVSDNLVGDTTREWVFNGYKTVGKVKVPSSRVTRQAGEVVEEATYDDVQIGTKPDASAFAKPAGFEELPQFTPAPTRETKLAEGVYLFESGANSLVVEFADHVMVIEPYAGGRGPKPTINKIREMFPGKPVKYVVVTHFHDDHSGGLRSYIAEGASVVTTPANQKFFEKMASGHFTVAFDDQMTAKKKATFEFVRDGKRVFTDGKQTVEIYDIGPSPHAREMLIAYLPKEKLVFQGDLVNLPNSGRWMPTSVIDATVHFYDSLGRLKLDVERIASVHGPATTLADLRAAVEKKRQQQTSSK
ncbi:MAG TPA: MBL fold metallo-hydrolase [Pyrinomonadaceae bacterium]|jgi:glyoxylase-like metal-dependent hydrolase (beta-lactamase superfamily II)|nr:MBL fold metallo-hydrolase [Pyrinomonadaceae bacterium]